MYVAKIGSIYIKKYNCTAYMNGKKSIKGKITNSFREAALFESIDNKKCDYLKQNGFKFYKILEMEADQCM